MENTSNKNGDIDLRVIFNTVKKPFVALWNFFIYSLQLTLKRWYILLFFLILEVAAGIAKFKTAAPIYSSTLVLSSSALNNNYCADVIDNLDMMLGDDTPELVAEKLNIDISSAKQIRKLDFDNYNEKINKKYVDSDTVILGLPFKIKAYALTYTVFDTLQKALIDYLDNSDFARKRRDIRKENIVKLRDKIRENIVQIDSIKFAVATNSMSTGSQTNIIVGKGGDVPAFNDPLSVFKEGILLYKEELNLNSSLLFSDNIEVIRDFSPRAKPDGSMTKFILKYGVVVFIFGWILIFLFELWKNRRSEKV